MIIKAEIFSSGIHRVFFSDDNATLIFKHIIKVCDSNIGESGNLHEHNNKTTILVALCMLIWGNKRCAKYARKTNAHIDLMSFADTIKSNKQDKMLLSAIILALVYINDEFVSEYIEANMKFIKKCNMVWSREALAVFFAKKAIKYPYVFSPVITNTDSLNSSNSAKQIFKQADVFGEWRSSR
jgi:hypothetical protein